MSAGHERRHADVLIPDPGSRWVEHPEGPQRRAAVCTLATGTHRRLLEITAPTLRAYARRHGYTTVLSSEDALSEGRPPSWAKLNLVRSLLDEFDYVFWIDADAIIVDVGRDVIDEVDDDADIWFARHPQNRDLDASVLNAGVFLARSSQFTLDLIDAVWNSEEFVDHNWWENAALLDVLGYSLEPPYALTERTAWHERIGRLSLDWNSVPGYCESERPAVNHHARSDHDDFERRVDELAADLRSTRLRFPGDFRH